MCKCEDYKIYNINKTCTFIFLGFCQALNNKNAELKRLLVSFSHLFWGIQSEEIEL